MVRSLSSPGAVRKTFELVAEAGPAPEDFNALFAALDEDPEGALDAVHDAANMPVDDDRSAYEMILRLLPADGFEAQRDLAASTDFPPGE